MALLPRRTGCCKNITLLHLESSWLSVSLTVFKAFGEFQSSDLNYLYLLVSLEHQYCEVYCIKIILKRLQYSGLTKNFRTLEIFKQFILCLYLLQGNRCIHFSHSLSLQEGRGQRIAILFNQTVNDVIDVNNYAT